MNVALSSRSRQGFLGGESNREHRSSGTDLPPRSRAVHLYILNELTWSSLKGYHDPPIVVLAQGLTCPNSFVTGYSCLTLVMVKGSGERPVCVEDSFGSVAVAKPAAARSGCESQRLHV